MKILLNFGMLLLCISTTVFAQQMPYPCITDAIVNTTGKRSATCSYDLVGYGTTGDCTVADSTCVVPTLACGKMRIPLAIGIIRQSDGTGGIDETVLAANLVETNLAFAGANIELYEYSKRYIDSDDFYTFSLQAADDDDTEVSANDIPDLINIYFTSTVANTSGGQACGYAALPGGGSNRLVISNDCVGPNLSTITHELGHSFGLYHTYETRFGADAADNSLGCSSGDRIVDTGAEPSPLFLQNDGSPCNGTTPCDCLLLPPDFYGFGCSGSCVYNGTGANAAYSPDIGNIMSTTPWTDCYRDHFSPCQLAKMWDVALDCRGTLCVQAGIPTAAFADSSFCYLTDPTPTMRAVPSGAAQTSDSCMYWYDAAIGGTLLNIGVTFSPIIIGEGDFSYFAEEVSPHNAICNSPARREIILRSDCDVPLDVELGLFEAKMEDCQVIVNWQTHSEQDNAFFILEHSGDGRFFTFLKKITGAGNSTEVIAYDYLDESPRWVTNYYRLISVDYSGKQQVSEVVVARQNCKGVKVHSLLPNPVSEVLTVNLQSTSAVEVRVQLFDVLGRSVFSQKLLLDGDQSVAPDLSKFPRGIYFLNVKETEGEFNASFRVLKE